MASVIKIVKYMIVGITYVVLCSMIFAVKTIYLAGRGNHTTRKTHTSFANLLSNVSESVNYFEIVEESVVRFEDLKRGETVDPEKIKRTVRRIREICEKYNETQTLRETHFLYSPEHGALYCWIRKVASTSFTKFFGELRGRRVSRNYYKEIKYLAPSSLEELRRIVNDKSVFKFLLVRHPFERLVSSYRDRIEDNSRYTAQAWIYAPRIFHVTRPELYRSNETIGNALQQIFTKNRRLKLIPTFGEYVTWLLKELPANDDVHWYQYHSHCSICNANFDYILKIDNYTLTDVDYIFSKLDIQTQRTILPKLQSTRGGSTDFSRTCDYFGNLSRDKAYELYERYRIDFEMFDYKYESYLNCATN